MVDDVTRTRATRISAARETAIGWNAVTSQNGVAFHTQPSSLLYLRPTNTIDILRLTFYLYTCPSVGETLYWERESVVQILWLLYVGETMSLGRSYHADYGVLHRRRNFYMG